MDVLRADDLKTLVEKRSGHCVTLYMPVYRGGNETRQNPIRLKNLLSMAEERLGGKGLRAPEIRAVLEPGQRLVGDRDFWEQQGDGLAVFLGEGISLNFRLSLSFEELIFVNDRFHVRPLMPLLWGEGRFYLLALSQNAVRMFKGSPHGISEVRLKDVPGSLAEALKYDDPQKQLQFHTGAPSAGAQRAAMFHGHGVGIDDEKDNILRYCQQVAKGVQEALKDERSPLVVAGVEFVQAIFREANMYPFLVEKGISGNPELQSPEELRSRGWDVVEPLFLKAREEAAARYKELAGTGKASVDIEHVVPAAHEGRVEVLFTALGARRVGEFDPETRSVRVREDGPEEDDLLELAAGYTFINRGTVYAVRQEDMPGDTPVAAVFRY